MNNNNSDNIYFGRYIQHQQNPLLSYKLTLVECRLSVTFGNVIFQLSR